MRKQGTLRNKASQREKKFDYFCSKIDPAIMASLSARGANLDVTLA